MLNAFQQLGLVGEELACRYLEGQNYKILVKNYKCALGEIDLIAKESGDLVFIEVKTRTSLAMGSPAEHVNFHKRRQIVKTAQYYMKRYGIHDAACRFDVVSVLFLPAKTPLVEVIRGAFLAGE